MVLNLLSIFATLPLQGDAVAAVGNYGPIPMANNMMSSQQQPQAQQQQQPTNAQIQAMQAQIAGQQQMYQQPGGQQQGMMQAQSCGGGGGQMPQQIDVYGNVNISGAGAPASGAYSGVSGAAPQLPAGQGPFYGPASNPMFGPATGTVQMETKNVTTTSITSVPLSASSGATSGESDESKATCVSSTASMVASRITDTEIRLKISGTLPLWWKQERKKYTKHMLHLFFTGVCAFVSFHLNFFPTTKQNEENLFALSGNFSTRIWPWTNFSGKRKNFIE